MNQRLSDEKEKTSKQYISRIFATILILASLAFVAHQIIQGLPQLSSHSWRFSAPALFGSFLLLFINFVLVSWVWTVVFRDLGEQIRISQSFAIIYAAQLARYIPGKIWIFLGQIYIAKKMGFQKTSAMTAVIVQNICGNLGAFLVLGITVLGAGYPSWMALAAFGAVLVGTGVLLIAPAWLEHWINRWRAGKGAEPIKIGVSRWAIIKNVLIMSLAWAEHCLAFALLVASMTQVDLHTIFELGLAYNVAYHFAFYILIIPGGLGVREGTITALIHSTFGSSLAGMIALVQRFWFLLGEIVAFGLSMLILRMQKPKG